MLAYAQYRRQTGESTDVLEKEQRNAALIAELHKVRALDAIATEIEI